MHPVVIFLFALLCILLFTAKLRLHPFLSLVLVSVLTGVLAGEPLATVEAITGGLGSVFSRFAIIITCGSVIGLLLQRTGGTSLIASDIIRFSRNPLLALNFLGFLFSVPLMCYILAYVIFIPIAKELAARLDNPPISTATALALGAVASFNLVYPSPVVISAAEELSANTDRLFILGFLIAIPTSIAGYLYARWLGRTEPEGVSNRVNQRRSEIQEKNVEIYRNTAENPPRLEAYSPIFFPLLLIFLQAGFGHSYPVLTFLGNPNIALLTGVILSIFSGRRLGSFALRELVEKAVRRSGVVLLDLCGGGALGATLAMTGAGEALGQLFLQLSLPHILIPFLVAAALQTVQGSRVVTMLIAPSLLLPLVPELGLPPEILILSMASGTFVISHVNDPFFWIFGELAELEPSEVFRSNTLGGALMGIVSFLLVSAAYVSFY
ncbi:GntP family permease [Methanosarcina sp.]|uniref:GntP family permease n=1 Tax=Methanosarcina sp. TaxID=2213 RepID=UPI003C76C919